MSLGGSRPAGGVPADVPALLRALLADDLNRPRLTWYGPDGERVEFSAKLLDNWVAKTANLLAGELDAAPGTRVAVVLPPHWRTVVWLLGIWSTGACAVLPPAGPLPRDLDAVVATDLAVLAVAPPAATRVAVALPALAASYGADLPPGVLDAAIDVRSSGDVFVPFVPLEPGEPAIDGPDGEVAHRDLLSAAARSAAALGERPRVLVGGGPEAVATEVLGPLARFGSVVLHHDLAALDADAVERLRTQEGFRPLPGG